MRRQKKHVTSALIALTVLASACGNPATTSVSNAAASPVSAASTITSTTEAGIVEAPQAGFACPVTMPPQPGFVATNHEDVVYSEQFPTPDPWPSEYPHNGMVWYGSDELWTALSVDGDHGGRKSVWWSVSFSGGVEEEQPDVSVTWTRLDTKESVVIGNGGRATNAYTPEEGWFMIAGIDPPDPGCWQVEASYKTASLSYVYER